MKENEGRSQCRETIETQKSDRPSAKQECPSDADKENGIPTKNKAKPPGKNIHYPSLTKPPSPALTSKPHP